MAGSLLALRSQVDAGFPRRSKASDGTKASAEHTKNNPGSDHEASYVVGGICYVTAMDITHDPVNGVDCERLFDVLWAHKDSRIKYIIWDREITSGYGHPSPWISRTYTGSNPHTKHLHLSVKAEPASLLQAPWNLEGLTMSPESLRADQVWGFPIHDLYTAKPDDVMSAGVAMEWAVRHAALANENASAALTTVQRVEAKLDRLLKIAGADVDES